MPVYPHGYSCITLTGMVNHLQGWAMLKNRMIETNRILMVILLSGMITITFDARAQMYKWVDAEGNTHYTQQLPPDGVEYETKKPPPSVNTEEAVDSFQKMQDEERKSRESKEKSGQEAAIKEQDQAELQKKCDSLRLRINSLQRPRITTTDENGNRARMPEEERLKSIEEAEKKLAEHCS
ncbi:MAG: hypothetical protein A2W76_00380 [Gammaproteobacteria bacterium RIFCSPLOWO2_12_47_11]|nr:MAG: hypothetical protein A2W76_00380 [Gammaproteobacteria bacterium RIFCSPLOWO2_12_47_11]